MWRQGVGKVTEERNGVGGKELGGEGAAGGVWEGD